MKKLAKFYATFAAALIVAASPVSRADEAKSAAAILPEKLVNASGEEVDTAEELEGKIVAIYFSAHWCPPCRTFTPLLVEFRNANADKDFEVVFASFDNSDAEKEKYVKEVDMKWLSVKGARSPEVAKLAEKYGVRGIPALVVLAPDGSTITADGRGDVSSDADGALAKWKEKAGGE